MFATYHQCRKENPTGTIYLLQGFDKGQPDVRIRVFYPEHARPALLADVNQLLETGIDAHIHVLD